MHLRCVAPPCAVCRVLVIGRAAYASLERSFPNSARLVLHNLKRKAENVSLGEHWAAPASNPLISTRVHTHTHTHNQLLFSFRRWPLSSRAS